MVAIMSPSTRSFSAVLMSMVVVVLYQATSVQAVQWFNGTADLPFNVSTTCVTALQADIPSCSSSMATIRPFVYPPQDYLTLLCTEDCNSALQSYESGVETACAGQTYNSTADGGYVPILAIPQLLRYSFNLTCLTDAASGQYCKVLAAAAIGIAANQSNLAAADVYGVDDGSGGCSDCVLKSLQFQASSPLFADNAADDAYTSATSSCSATGYPLTATTALFTATVATATATATASRASCDRTYSIQSDDTCASISKAHEIGTTWLLSDNNLAGYCSNFPTNGSLCLNHSCTTYTVQANDTCQTIESAHNLTLAQVLAWNPQLDLACSNLNMSLGLELCVGSPGTPYTAPNSTANTSGTGSSSGSGTTATAPAAIPDNIANGTNTDCAKYYAVQGGDYCNLLVLRFGISLADFLFLNPDINSNCTNLYTHESYCVEPVGDISSYPGYGGVTPIGNLTGTSGSFSSFSNATYMPTLFAGYNRTLANSTVSTCTDYFNGADYQDDLTGTFYASNCALAASVYGITTANLATWNPSLGSNATDSSCAFSATAWYCAGYGGDYPDLTNDTISDDANATATASATPPAPTQSGEPADCNMWYVAQANDTCSTPEDAYGVSHAQFIAWNPAVSSDCSSGFWVDEAYCVGTASSGADATTTTSPASSTPTTSAASATSPTPPAPTQAGEPADCNAWYVAQANDGCATVAEAHGITTDQFLEWNPAVSSDCSSGFWVDEAYCVGTASSSSSTATSWVTPISTTTTSASSTSAASATSPTPPAPTQAGEPSNCNQWFVAESGNSCATATDEYEITMDQFLEWNPAVSSDCVDGFWAGEAYCVGVASS